MKGIQVIRTVLFSLVLVAGLASMPGCNTVEGAGEDIERAGEKTQDAARDAKR